MRAILLLTLLSLFACHPKAKNNRGTERQVTPPREQPQLPQIFAPAGGEGYHLADPNCAFASTGATKIDESTVYKLDLDQVNKKRHQFADTNSINSLSSPKIVTTIYGHGERAQCELVNGKIVCGENVQATSQARPLKICNPNQDFQRSSYEAVALTTMSAIETANAYYQIARSHDPALPKSQLIVLPVIEQLVKFTDQSGNERQESIYMTDNMAFMPDLIGKPAFVVFPKGPFISKLGIWKNVNLWESDWVIAHEFGHHVFMHHTKAATATLQSINVHNMPTHAPFKSVKSKQAVSLAGKNAPFAAVNEGFADLFGFFSVKQQSSALNGLDCFRKSRDASVAHFANGRVKRLDREVLEIFGGLRNPIQADGLGCDAPDFSEVHSVGAVMAHAIYDILKQSDHFKNLAAHDPQFAEILLDWANQLGKTYGSKVILVPGFEPLVKPILTIIAGYQSGKLSAGQCQTIDEKLPSIAAGLKTDLCNL